MKAVESRSYRLGGKMLEFIAVAFRRVRSPMLIGSIVSVVLGLSFVPAVASPSTQPKPCVVFPRTSADLPPEIAAFFADSESKVPANGKSWLHGAAVERCQFSKDAVMGSFAYTLLAPPQARGGVCYFSRLDITPMFSEDRKFLGNDRPDRNGPWPPQQMVVAEPPCPLQDDKSYSYVEKVPPGVFRGLVLFWREAFASDTNMDAAMSWLSPEQRASDDYKNFRAMVRHRSGLAPQPFRIGLADSRLYTGHETTAYEIDVDYWHVEVDLTDQGWRILQLHSVVY